MIVMDKFKLYIDMDGVLAEFKEVNHIEKLYEKNYFASLQPLCNVVNGVKEFINQIKDNESIDVYILSSVLKDSYYAENEKNEWLDEHLPEIDQTHRIFLSYGKDKADIIEELGSKSILIDDYTHNLQKWSDKGGIAIKLINPINNRHQSWQGATIDYSLNPTLLAYTIKRIMMEEYIKKSNIKDLSKKAKKIMEVQKAKEKNISSLTYTKEVGR